MTPIRLVLAAALVALAPLSAGAEPLARQLFGAQPRPTQGASEPVGAYSRGCAAGLVALPETGPTWQAMRLKRNRFWGQPELVAYLQDLSAFAATLPGWQGLYIGDLSQPRGGPMTGGHASHQIGLDADIWMLPPPSLSLTRSEREQISSISVRSAPSMKGRPWPSVPAASVTRTIPPASLSRAASRGKAVSGNAPSKRPFSAASCQGLILSGSGGVCIRRGMI